MPLSDPEAAQYLEFRDICDEWESDCRGLYADHNEAERALIAIPRMASVEAIRISATDDTTSIGWTPTTADETREARIAMPDCRTRLQERPSFGALRFPNRVEI